MKLLKRALLLAGLSAQLAQCGQAGACADDDRHARLQASIASARRAGAWLSDALEPARTTTGWSLRATRGIAAGQALLTVPLRAGIFMHVSDAAAALNATEAELDAFTDEALLALLVAWSRAVPTHPRNRWAEWAASLPADAGDRAPWLCERLYAPREAGAAAPPPPPASAPASARCELLERLGPSYWAGEAVAKAARVAAAEAAARRLLVHDEAAAGGALDVRWGHAIVASRLHRVELGGGETLRALAPLADLLDFAAAPSAACGTEEGGVFACRARAPLEPGATPTVDYASARHAGRFAFDYGFALDARGDDASATLSFPRWVERLGAALGDAEWAPRVASREPTLALEFERARRAGVALSPRDVSASFVAGSLIGRAAAAAVAVAAEDGHDPGRVVAAAAAALRDDHGAAAEAASRECEAGAHPAAPACIAAAVLRSELAVLDALAHLPAR